MKLEEAVPGRWIERGSNRWLVIGTTLGGSVVCEDSEGYYRTLVDNEVDWDNWTLLPAECDSFDWQPETFPQWWTSLDSSASPVAFVKRYDSVRWHTVRKDGSESIDLGLGSDWNPEGRKQLTEAEALALLDKKPEPVESPDDWVTQDRVMYRPGIDQYRHVTASGRTGQWVDVPWAEDLRHGVDGGELRCRRKDLPPLSEPEPVKPATRKVVPTEWLIETQNGDAYVTCLKNAPYVASDEKAHTIGTREIEVPL